MSIRRLVLLLAVAALSGCADDDAASGPSASRARATETQAPAAPASAADDAYVSAVRSAWRRLEADLPVAKETFNHAQTLPAVRTGLRLYERVFTQLVADLHAAEPAPSGVARRHYAFIALTTRMAGIYHAMIAEAHGSIARTRRAFASRFKAISSVGPRWAKAGDALLNAL